MSSSCRGLLFGLYLYFGTFLSVSLDKIVHASDAVTLRVAVTGEPPLTTQNADGSLGGFQMDMLMAVKGVAEEEGVSLELQIEDLSGKYTNGPAFDLVASDCNETLRGNKSDCGRFDLLLAPVFSTPTRFARADLTPPLMQGYVTAVRYSEAPLAQQYSTFAELERVNGTCCAPVNSLMLRTIRAQYPRLQMLECNSNKRANSSTDTGCIQPLKEGKCALLGGFVGTLKYQALQDPSLVLVKEALRKNYIIWSMPYTLPLDIRNLFKRWVYTAVTRGVADELYTHYYEPKVCPLGWAGENCTQYCDPEHGQSDRLGHCVCDSLRYTGPDCATQVLLDENLIPSYQIVVGVIMFGINLAAVLFSGAWVFRHRSSSRVRMAQPFCLGLVLLGCLISSSTILAFMGQAATNQSHNLCMLIPWLYSVGFSITFGTLFTKIYRVHKVYKNAMRMRRVQVTLLSALRWIALVLCADMAILIVWQVFDPLEWKRTVQVSDKYGYVLESVGTCHSQHWTWFTCTMAAFHFVLVSKAAYMCFQTRTVPNHVSGARGVSIAMISNFQIFLVGVPVLFLVGSDANASFFLRSAIVWINDLVVVLAIFGDLMYGSHEAASQGRITRISGLEDQQPDTSLSGISGSSYGVPQRRPGVRSKGEQRCHESKTGLTLSSIVEEAAGP